MYDFNSIVRNLRAEGFTVTRAPVMRTTSMRSQLSGRVSGVVASLTKNQQKKVVANADSQ